MLTYRADVASRDHGDPGDAPSVPPPSSDVASAVRPSAAEEARTIAASTNTGTLATLTASGDPWASFVTYGLLDGAPVLCVSNMAEHGRNLAGDPRASIAIVAPATDPDPLASGRVTLAGVVERPSGDELAAARQRTSGRGSRGQVLRRLQRLHAVGAAGRIGCAGSAATAGWTPRPARRTPPPRPTRSSLWRRARSATSTPTTPRRCARWRETLGGYPDTTAADMHRRRPLRAGPARSVRRAGWHTPGSDTPHRSTRIDELRSATVELRRHAGLAIRPGDTIPLPELNLAGRFRADPHPRPRAPRGAVQAGQRSAQPRLHRRQVRRRHRRAVGRSSAARSPSSRPPTASSSTPSAG